MEREVFRLLEAMGYHVTPTGASPLDALSREGETSLLTGVSDADARLVRKARIMASVSRVTEQPGVFIVQRTVTRMNIEGAPLISREELKRLREPESVLDLIQRREKGKKEPVP
jgi:putative transcriptional regulator